MELSRVKGLGPAKVEVLQAAGITSAEDLASVDLRKRPDIEGVSADALKAYKQRARQLLQSEGVSFAKAPYDKDKAPAAKKQKSPTTKKSPVAKAQKKPSTPTRQAPAKRGLFARLFRRS